VTTDTVETLLRLLIALLVMVTAALMLALVAWWRSAGCIRQCRATVGAYQRLAEQMAARMGGTMPYRPVVDDDPDPVPARQDPPRSPVFDRRSPLPPAPRDGSTAVLPSTGTLPAPSPGWWNQVSASGRHGRQDARPGVRHGVE
jgi:hypothetical protein